jgi:hypothetical protein
MRPHWPQLFGSVCRLMQAVPHTTLGAKQLLSEAHSPFRQTLPGPQRRLHPPQLLLSVCVSVQLVPHTTFGLWHALSWVQEPFTQV